MLSEMPPLSQASEHHLSTGGSTPQGSTPQGSTHQAQKESAAQVLIQGQLHLLQF